MEVTRTAPAASRMRPASHCDLPVRGPPKMQMTSSIDAHTRSSPARHSSTATSAVRAGPEPDQRAQRVVGASEGRTVAARRRMARLLATRTMSVVEATPALRRARAPQRTTIAEVRACRCHSHSANGAASRASTHQGVSRKKVMAGRIEKAPNPTPMKRAPRRQAIHAAPAEMANTSRVEKFMAWLR